MLLVVSLYDIKPEWVDRWPALTEEFTVATRAEQGNLYFAWSRDLDQSDRFVLVEAFRDDAVQAHLRSPLVTKILETWRPALARDPSVLQSRIDGDTWTVMPDFGVGDGNGAVPPSTSPSTRSQ